MRYLIVTSLIWAFSFSLIKTYLVGLPSYLVASIRIFLSFIIFLPFFKIRIFKDKKQFFSLLVLGAIQYGLMYLAYIASYKFLKAYEIAIFTVFTPIFIVLFEELFAKKFSLKLFLAPLLAVIGTGIIVFKQLGTTNLWYGVLLIQVSNISFAFGQVFYKKIKKTYKAKDKDLFPVIYLGAVLLSLISVLTFKDFIQVKLISSTQWQVLLYLGVVASGLCFFMWNKGGTLVSGKTLAVMNNVKIPLAVIVGVVLFKEKTNVIRLVTGISFMLYALKISYKKEVSK